MDTLTNHLWQSTVFACVAATVTLALRGNRAAVRYWVWFAASLKFLVPFALLIGVGRHVEWTPPRPAVSSIFVQAAEPFSPDPARMQPQLRENASRDWTPLALLGLWMAGAAGVAVYRWSQWREVRRALLAGRVVDWGLAVEVRMAQGLLEPGVVGWLRPVLLLPEGIVERLTPPQLESILAHEFCHVRRRDNLLSAIHMVVEGIFWFHPLVWWIGARLVQEREQACDEEVLLRGSQPHVYAEGILAVCKLYVESPLVCVAGVTGADLRKRLEAILLYRGARGLSLSKKAALTLAGAAAVVTPLWIGAMHPPSVRAQGPQFEVASVKLTSNCGESTASFGGGGLMKKGGGSVASPGRAHLCGTLEELIQWAYVVYENGYANRNGARLNRPPMAGGPAWVRSDKYVIDAKADSAPGEGVMYGVMMRALLEERFHLKVRHESREVPVYQLTALSSGAKAPPHRDGTCVIHDPNLPMPAERPANPCMYQFHPGTVARELALEAQGVNYDNLAKLAAVALGRPVINKTGIAGLYDFHLEFRPDEDTPFVEPRAEASDPGPSIFVAMREQLGLKLEQGRGPQQFLVIDGVQRPSEN